MTPEQFVYWLRDYFDQTHPIPKRFKAGIENKLREVLRAMQADASAKTVTSIQAGIPESNALVGTGPAVPVQAGKDILLIRKNIDHVFTEDASCDPSEDITGIKVEITKDGSFVSKLDKERIKKAIQGFPEVHGVSEKWGKK